MEHNIWLVSINNIVYVVEGKNKAEALTYVNNYVNHIVCNDYIKAEIKREATLLEIDDCYIHHKYIDNNGIRD